MPSFRARFAAVLLFAAVGAAASYATALNRVPVFTSTALLLSSPSTISILDYKPATLNLTGDRVVLETHIQLLRSPDTLDRVVAVLLERGPRNEADVLPDSPILLREYLAENLRIRRVNATEILEISFSSTDPDLAAFIANEVVTQFLESQREAKVAELTRVAAAIDARVTALASAAEAAEAALVDARRDLTDTETPSAALLADVTTKLEERLTALDNLGPVAAADAGATLNATRAALNETLAALRKVDEAGGSTETIDASIGSLVREAEVKAAMHRDMLKRALEVQELSYFTPDDMRVVASAVPAVTSSSIPPLVVSAVGLLAFFLLGALLAFTVGTGRRLGQDWA
ncbi:MAG TPA: hypothetical protein VK146_02955 [Tabrizicola sp.]|nr:hypothetical protein [Tabrizicola sp.]